MTLLRCWSRQPGRSPARRQLFRNRSQRGTYRPRTEWLEDRTLLSTGLANLTVLGPVNPTGLTDVKGTVAQNAAGDVLKTADGTPADTHLVKDILKTGAVTLHASASFQDLAALLFASEIPDQPAPRLSASLPAMFAAAGAATKINNVFPTLPASQTSWTHVGGDLVLDPPGDRNADVHQAYSLPLTLTPSDVAPDAAILLLQATDSFPIHVRVDLDGAPLGNVAGTATVVPAPVPPALESPGPGSDESVPESEAGPMSMGTTSPDAWASLSIAAALFASVPSFWDVDDLISHQPPRPTQPAFDSFSGS